MSTVNGRSSTDAPLSHAAILPLTCGLRGHFNAATLQRCNAATISLASGAIKTIGQERGQVVRLNLANIAGADNLSAFPFAGIDRPY